MMNEGKKGAEESGKRGKGKGKRRATREKKEETALTIAGTPIKIDKRYEKMSLVEIVETLQKEGVLVLNPLEVVDQDTSVKLGGQAGTIYGAAIHTIKKAIIRDDLPIDKRVNLGIKGFTPILAMFFKAIDINKDFDDMEDSLLSGETYEEMMLRLKSPRRRLPPTKQEVIADLQQRLKEVEEEKIVLEAKLSGKKPTVRMEEDLKPDQ